MVSFGGDWGKPRCGRCDEFCAIRVSSGGRESNEREVKIAGFVCCRGCLALALENTLGINFRHTKVLGWKKCGHSRIPFSAFEADRSTFSILYMLVVKEAKLLVHRCSVYGAQDGASYFQGSDCIFHPNGTIHSSSSSLTYRLRLSALLMQLLVSFCA